MSEVRGRSWEDPMPKGRQSRGGTPHPRSGAAAESARLRRCKNAREELPLFKFRGGHQEELTLVRGQARWPRGATPCLMSGVAPERSYSFPEARGCSREEQPHVQGVVAARAQECLEELFHI